MSLKLAKASGVIIAPMPLLRPSISIMRRSPGCGTAGSVATSWAHQA